MNNNIYDTDHFIALKTRLKRILKRCGWTLKLHYKPSGYYVWAVKRDEEGKPHSKYMAPFYRTEDMDTGTLLAILPDVL